MKRTVLAEEHRVIFSEPSSGTLPADRLGGVYSIATVMDDFLDRITIDPRLNANPLVDEVHHRVPPAGFKYLDRDGLLGYGRPTKIRWQVDDGRSCPLENYWRRVGSFLDDFQQTLDKFGVPVEEQAELKSIVDSTRSDIVVDSRLAADGANA